MKNCGNLFLRILTLVLFYYLISACVRNDSKIKHLNYKGYAILYLSDGNFSYLLPVKYSQLFENNYSLRFLISQQMNPIQIGIYLSSIVRWNLKRSNSAIPYFFENAIDSSMINTEKTPNPIYGGDSIEVFRVYVELDGAKKFDRIEVHLGHSQNVMEVFEIFTFNSNGGLKKLDIVEEKHIGSKLKRLSVLPTDSDRRMFPILE